MKAKLPLNIEVDVKIKTLTKAAKLTASGLDVVNNVKGAMHGDLTRIMDPQTRSLYDKVLSLASGEAGGEAKKFAMKYANPSILKAFKKIESLQKSAEKAVSNTVSDMKGRVPGAVASCVTSLYNIKKSEITPRSTKSGKQQKKAGSIVITGDTLENLAYEYQGRLLTPTHFGMSPKSPPKGKSYTLTATIRKDRGKQVIGRYKNTRTKGGTDSQQSHFILMGTGNTKEGGTNFIPFQRRSTGRLDLKKMTTLSVPQMIGEEKIVQPAIQAKLTELLGARLDHNMSKIK